MSVLDGNALKAATAARHVVPPLRRLPERANSREHKERDHDSASSEHDLGFNESNQFTDRTIKE